MNRQSFLHGSYTWHQYDEARKSAILASALGTVFEWHDFYLLPDAGTVYREAMKP
jgi:hypothetical protein